MYQISKQETDHTVVLATLANYKFFASVELFSHSVVVFCASHESHFKTRKSFWQDVYEIN